MGDRANICIKQADGQVWLYGHWAGHHYRKSVRDALAKRWRWNDESYLARIIFDVFSDKHHHAGQQL